MLLPSSISWIAFDAVGTLITPRPGVAEVYWQTARRYGSRLDIPTIQLRFREAFVASETACFAPARRGQTSEPEEWSRWRWIVAQVVTDVPDLEPCFADLWDHFGQPQHWVCYPEVESVLTELIARGYRCALASNFDARLHRLVTGHPALRHCEPRLVSSEVGYRKPAAGFYRTLLERCEALPCKVLMVGDDSLADVVAPRELGMAALWLHRKAADPEAIASLTSLLDLLPVHAPPR